VETAVHRYETSATVDADGSVTLRALPFKAGDRVEVVLVQVERHGVSEQNYPLRGTPYRYDLATEPVAADDWEVAQ
jgi:hypothetical protein